MYKLESIDKKAAGIISTKGFIGRFSYVLDVFYDCDSFIKVLF
jgi:hypothetical protein